MDKVISDVSLRKLTGIKGETKVVAIGGGLQLWVTVNQAGQTLKSWVLRYYDAQGKRQKARIGTYPELSLAKAQAAAEDLKKQAKDGVNIAQARAQEQRVKIEGTQEAQAAQQNTFEVVAEMWLEKKALTWVPGHLKRQKERLQGHLYHAIGNKPVTEITMLDIDAALSPLAKVGKNETAKGAADLVRNVMEYAETMGLLENSAIISRVSKYRREVPTLNVKRHLYKEMTEVEAGKLLLALEESKLRWTRQHPSPSALPPMSS